MNLTMKNLIAGIIIISVFYLGRTIYLALISFDSLSKVKDQILLTVHIDDNAYSNLDYSQSQEIISEITEMDYFRGRKPDYHHGNRTISFTVRDRSHRLGMYFNLDICKPEKSVVVLNDKGYRVNKEDAIKLLHIFDETLPLDGNDVRCSY